MAKKVQSNEKSAQNNKIGERISQVRKEFFGGDTAKLAEVLGIHYTSVSHLIKGDYPINHESTRRLLEYCPDLSADWFILGRGTMRNSQNINGSNNVANGQNISNVTTCDPQLMELAGSQQRTIEKLTDLLAQAKNATHL